MSASAIHPTTPSGPTRDGRSLSREILETTLSYMQWGYGVLLLSCVGNASFAGFKALEKAPEFPAKSILTVFVSLAGALLGAASGYYYCRIERKPKDADRQILPGTEL